MPRRCPGLRRSLRPPYAIDKYAMAIATMAPEISHVRRTLGAGSCSTPSLARGTVMTRPSDHLPLRVSSDNPKNRL
jgi:hypothetical protein